MTTTCAARPRHTGFTLGFTLIELLVVVGILAAVAYIAWSSYAGVQERAEDEIARAEMLRLADALRRFKADTGHYPGQGPFALAAPGTVETPSGGGIDCTPVGGVLRSWAQPAVDGDRDAWFASPANLALLFDAPALCANHPLAHLSRWNPETRRGWHGPYLGTAARAWVDHGADFNTDTLGVGAPDGQGSPLLGAKLHDIPAFGAGPRYPAVLASGMRCGDAHLEGNGCLLGWRSIPRATAGYDHTQHDFPAHARPFALFGLNGDAPRIVYFGRDGRYGGRNMANACQPRLTDPDGADDQVLCLGN
jgi:prepilin-type N-terminal cleavage/methylation domain-containing protein